MSNGMTLEEYQAQLAGVSPEPTEEAGMTLEEYQAQLAGGASPGLGADTPQEYTEDEYLLEARAGALEEEYREYDLMRKQVYAAKDIARMTDEPIAKVRAAAKAQYLQDKMVGAKPSEEELQEFLATSRLPGAMPGKKEGFLAAADVGDFLTSPVSRPLFSVISASADTGALANMPTEERVKWLDNMHPEDPRRDIYWELHELTEAAKEDPGSALSTTLKKAGWSGLLALRYWLPGIDPYGGGPARPWQETERGGVIVGDESAATADILARSLVRGEGADAAADWLRSTVHGLAEYAEVLPEAFGALAPGGESFGEAWSRSAEEAYKVWSGHPDADPYEGSFLPSLLFTVAPELVLSPSGVFKGIDLVRTGAGVVTKAGDQAMMSSVSRVTERLTSEALVRDPGLSTESLEALVDASETLTKQAYATIGDLATRGVRLDGAGDVAKTADELVADIVPTAADRVGVVHIDLGDAVTLKTADDGALVPALDLKKARALYADDPLIKKATRDAVMRSLDEPEKALLKRALDDMDADDLSSVEIFANLKQRGFGNKLALAGGLGFGAGALSAAEGGDLGDILKGGLKGGLAGLAGGTVAFGGGKGIGTVIDSTGRAAIKLGFPTGSLRLELLEKGRKGLPGFKELKPWATKTADGDWRAIEFADLIGDHKWAHARWLARRRGFTEKQLQAESGEAIFNVFKERFFNKRERELAAVFSEVLDDGSKAGSDAHTILRGLRHHLTKALRFLPAERSRYFDLDLGGSPSLGSRFDKEGDMWEAFDAAIRANDIDEIESFISAQSSMGYASGGDHLRSLGNRVKHNLKGLSSTSGGRYLKARVDYILESAKAKKGGGMAGRARTRADRARRELEALQAELGAGTVAKKGRGKKAKLERERAEAADELRSLLREDPYVPGVGRSAVDVITRHAEKATMISQILRQVTGVADEVELRALEKVERYLSRASGRAAKRLQTDEEFVKALEGLSPLDVKRAHAAFRKRKPNGTLDPRYVDASDDVKRVVDGVRGFFSDAFRRLQAEGALPMDWSLEHFLDSMEVSGYVSHMLTKGGARTIRSLKKKGLIGGLSTALDVVEKRGLKGTIEEINQETRLGIAEMIWRNLNSNRPRANIKRVPREELESIIANEGLDKIKFFETDAAKIMSEYGGKTARWISNTRYIKNITNMFKEEGDRLASIAGGDGFLAADAAAQAVGYRRVDGVLHLRAIAGEGAWPGFKKHKEAIQRLLIDEDPSVRGAKLYEFLRKHGADIDDPMVKVHAETLSRYMYVPSHYADMIETLAVPSHMQRWASGDGVLAKAIGTWDDVTNYFKMATTLLASAFHGRNYVSNTITNLMVHGPSSLRVSNQIDSIFLMRAPDGAEWTLTRVTPGGRKVEITQTVKEWRNEMRKQGIIADVDLSDQIRSGVGKPSHLKTGLMTDADPVDIGRSKAMTALFGVGEYSRVLKASSYQVPAYTAALGAAIGGLAGYGSGGTNEERLRKAFTGVLVGGMAGMGTGSMYDLFLKDPFSAAKQAYGEAGGPAVRAGLLWKSPEFYQNMKPAFSAGFDEWMDIIGGAEKAGFKNSVLHVLSGTSAGRVALVGGAVGGLIGGATTTQDEGWVGGAMQGAAAGMLLTGGTKAWGEGAFVIAGGLGRKIEEQAKIASYIAGRKKGMSPDAAADIVHKTLFDYNDLSAFERHWLRRFFPFYTWSSKNATALQPWLVQNRPKSVSFMTKFLDAADGGFSATEDYAFLPEHMRYRAVVNAGLGKVFAGFGLPQEDFVELLKFRGLAPSGVIGRMHPAMLLLYKFTASKDPYYNVDLDQVRSGRDVRYLPPFIQRYVGFAEVERTRLVDGVRQTYTSYEVGIFPGDDPGDLSGRSKSLGAKRLALLRALPAWRLVSEYNKMMTDTFMPALRAESGAKATADERLLALFSGIKPYAVNWDSLESYAYQRFEEGLTKELEEQGLLTEMPIMLKEPRTEVGEVEALRELGIYKPAAPARRSP